MRAAENNTIIIGDFNLPGIDWKNEQARDAKGKLLLETAVEEGLQQLVDFPTHTKGNTLDLLLTNCPDKVIKVSDSGRLGRSDHCMLKVVLDFEPNLQRELSASTTGARPI
jgi:endonuclease/exonuclease/phosphatase family metal-dependent hydrolase